MLVQALSVFALRNIDMTKIESRPMSSNPLGPDPSVASVAGKRLNNLFHIDFVANLAEQRAQNALRQLQVRTWYSCKMLLASRCCCYAVHAWSGLMMLAESSFLLRALSYAGNSALPACFGMLSHVHRAEDDSRIIRGMIFPRQGSVLHHVLQSHWAFGSRLADQVSPWSSWYTWQC